MRAVLISGMAGLGIVAILAACASDARPREGARIYTDFCASCHGTDGRGDASAAGARQPGPPDLTMLAANNGGVFPENRVMGQLVDYSMGRSESHMPVFEELREGPAMMVDDGTGQRVAMPARLVELTAYLRDIQR